MLICKIWEFSRILNKSNKSISSKLNSQWRSIYQLKYFQIIHYSMNILAIAQWCSVKRLFLKISKNSQKNTCARLSFLNKVASLSSNTGVSSEFCELFWKPFSTGFLQLEAALQRCSCKNVFWKMQQILQEDTHAKITLRHRCSPVNLQHIFRTCFSKNTSGGLLLSSGCFCIEFCKTSYIALIKNISTSHLKLTAAFIKIQPAQRIGFIFFKKTVWLLITNLNN